MLKRYLILTAALSFMAISIPRCPIESKTSTVRSSAQAPAATQAAVTQSTTPRL